MQVKKQWIVYQGGYVLLIFTMKNGYFLQKGINHEFLPIKSTEAKSVIEKTKRLIKQ